MKKPIVGVICPIEHDPTSWYRGKGPLCALEKEGLITIKVPPAPSPTAPASLNWSFYKSCDLFFMQRPSHPDHFQIMCQLKDMGIPIWVDFDDDNLSVPKDNQMYAQYAEMRVKEAIVNLTRHADILTVSTQFLKNKYDIYRPQDKACIVVPNALDETLLHLRKIPERPRDKTLLWRGTPSHTRNLKVIENEIIRIALENPAWRFTFFGLDPIDITDQIKNFQLIPFVGIHDFYKHLCVLHASALYYSLGSNDHSQARSHVVWLEATFAGTMTIASKTLEFTRPGILNFENPHEFGRCLESVIKNEVDVDKHVKESWDCIQENYMLSKVNLLRKQVIQNLIGM